MGVTIYQFAHVLPLVGAFLDDLAVVLEKVINEELVELICWALLILIYLSCKGLAENQGVHKAARNWL